MPRKRILGNSSAHVGFLLLRSSRGWTVSPHGLSLCSVANAHDDRKLSEKVRQVICEEWEGTVGSLQSALVYRRLLEEGVEVPGYQMSAILNSFKVGGLITVPLGPQSEEEVRKHGDLLIMSVSPALCNPS